MYMLSFDTHLSNLHSEKQYLNGVTGLAAMKTSSAILCATDVQAGDPFQDSLFHCWYGYGVLCLTV